MNSALRNRLWTIGIVALLLPACGGGSGGADPASGGTVTPPAAWAGLGSSSWNVESTTGIVGGSAHGPGVSDLWLSKRDPAVAVAADGYPLVAWISEATQRIYLVKWDGTQWAEFAGSGSGNGISGPGFHYAPSIALTPDGRPIVAWHEQVSGPGAVYEVKLRRWTGTAWEDLGGTPIVSGLDGLSLDPSVVSDAAGNPVVAWQEDANTPSRYLYLKRWTGSAWAGLGGSATAGGVGPGGGHASLALDAAGNPTVAWIGGGVLVRRWDPIGSSWIEFAGSGTGGGLSSGGDYCSMALDASGNPVVCWQEGSIGVRSVYLKRWTGTAWAELGGSATGSGLSASIKSCERPTLALDASGNPIVSYEEEDATAYGKVRVRHWTGVAWEDWGSVTGNGYSRTSLNKASALAYGAAGPAAIAWYDGSQVYLVRRVGNAWAELDLTSPGLGGVSATPSATSTFPSLDLDSSGSPSIAWHEIGPSGPRVHVRQWTGSQWGELSGSATTNGISATPSFPFSPVRLKVDPSDRPVVAWAGSAGATSIRVRAWNGSSWMELAGSDSGTGISGATPGEAPSLVLDGSGRPTVAWHGVYGGSTDVVFLKQWDGSAWVERAGSATGSGLGESGSIFGRHAPSVGVDGSGKPSVAWIYRSVGLYFLRWSGTSWDELGGSATGTGVNPAFGGGYTALILDSQSRPVIAWTDGSVFLKRWNGSTWIELGGSASGSGISGTVGGLMEPQVILDSSDNPIVAWTGASPDGGLEIYVKRWDGSQWTEWGTHSGSQGGISNAKGISFRPALAGRGGVLGVAWEDWGETYTDIYYRTTFRP